MPYNYKTELHRYRRYYQSIEQFVAKPQTHAFTTAIFSFLAISLFGWYAIRPTLQTILYLRREIDDNKKVNQQMEEKIGKLIEAQSSYQSAQDVIPYMTQALPETSDVLAALGQIRNIALIRGASISAITSSSAPLLSKEKSIPNKQAALARGLPNRIAKSVQLSVNLKGTYEILEGIIKDIVSMRRLISIESFNITLDSESEKQLAYGSVPLKLILKLNVYYIDSE
ncbi:MAG: hypothetical protein AAB481_02885 [Patescibacteria group bacterium]